MSRLDPKSHEAPEPQRAGSSAGGERGGSPDASAPPDLAARIAAFVRHRFPLVVHRGLGPDDSLLDSGVVDSMGIWDIVAFFEEELGLRLEDHDLVPENFDSITALVTLARAKQS